MGAGSGRGGLGGAGGRASQSPRQGPRPRDSGPTARCRRKRPDHGAAAMTSGLFTRVTFKVSVETEFGDSVFVTGNAPILGNRPAHLRPARLLYRLRAGAATPCRKIALAAWRPGASACGLQARVAVVASCPFLRCI